MQKRQDVHRLTIGALLLALSLIIPLAFGGIPMFSLTIGPFSATIASHVPLMIAMLFGPKTPALWALVQRSASS